MYCVEVQYKTSWMNWFYMDEAETCDLLVYFFGGDCLLKIPKNDPVKIIFITKEIPQEMRAQPQFIVTYLKKNNGKLLMIEKARATMRTMFTKGYELGPVPPQTMLDYEKYVYYMFEFFVE